MVKQRGRNHDVFRSRTLTMQYVMFTLIVFIVFLQTWNLQKLNQGLVISENESLLSPDISLDLVQYTRAPHKSIIGRNGSQKNRETNPGQLSRGPADDTHKMNAHAGTVDKSEKNDFVLENGGIVHEIPIEKKEISGIQNVSSAWNSSLMNASYINFAHDRLMLGATNVSQANVLPINRGPFNKMSMSDAVERLSIYASALRRCRHCIRNRAYYERLAELKHLIEVYEKLEELEHRKRVSKLNKETLRNDTCNGCFTFGFNYVTSGENICRGKANINLIFLITTTHKNFQRRQVLRNTWLTYAYRMESVAYAFLLGETSNESLSHMVMEENKIFNDIVKTDFTDSYRNLTYKTVMGLKWVTEKCPQAQYVMKTDDDMYINVPALLKKLSEMHVQKRLVNATMGACWTSKPIRNETSKYYVSLEEYPHFYYPPFCSGTGYIMSMRIAEKLFDVSRNIPMFHLEDVYVGICLKQLGLSTYNYEEFLVSMIGRRNICVAKTERVLSLHAGSSFHIQRIWKSAPCDSSSVQKVNGNIYRNRVPVRGWHLKRNNFKRLPKI